VVISEKEKVDEGRALVIWRVTDGKAGHEAQTQGLVDALARQLEVQAFDVKALNRIKAAWQWGIGRFNAGVNLPDPDLIIGAGHGTHLTLLAARRSRGGKCVVLMQPSLPSSWFDLCFIPEHDAPSDAANVFTTVGVLNTVLPTAEQAHDRGLILIGGPSTHYGWKTPEMIRAVREIVRADPMMRWVLTTSRRTPNDTEKALNCLNEANLEVVPFAATQRGWVNQRLEECATVWVTEESVSMVFEALTSGAGVGLLSVPLTSKKNRVSTGIDSLKEKGSVLIFKYNQASYSIVGRQDALAEADRCAAIVQNHFA
jgi:mitochondrial fission protein ELM1